MLTDDANSVQNCKAALSPQHSAKATKRGSLFIFVVSGSARAFQMLRTHHTFVEIDHLCAFRLQRIGCRLDAASGMIPTTPRAAS